jgi:hypothetical protein
VCKRDRRVWRAAHARLALLRHNRDELRQALAHLGPGALSSATHDSILDLRRACGARWFDDHYGRYTK